LDRLGLKAPVAEARGERKLTEEGEIIMGYDSKAVPLVKSLPGARWNPEKKLWTVSTQPRDLPRVIEVADQLQLTVPQSFRDRLGVGTVDSQKARARAEAARRNDGKKLFEFQKAGVEFLALHDHALLADDMGLGKTVQALVAIPDNAPLIVICPAAVKYNWRSEIEMWRPEYKVIICNGRDSFVVPNENEAVIINYDILPKWLEPKETEEKDDKGKPKKEVIVPEDIKKALSKVVLIGDEFHLAKNYKAARSQKVSSLSRLCKIVWALTGTPLMNKPPDLFGTLAAGNMYPFGGWISEKLDGHRAYWDGKKLLSRNGNTITAPDFFTKGFPPFPLDGELWAGRKNRFAIQSLGRKPKPWEKVIYAVFDAPDSKSPFEERLERFRCLTEAHLVPLKFTLCNSKEHLLKALDKVVAAGGEGLMLRRPGSLYVDGRSHTLLKVKPWIYSEAVVIGHDVGKAGGDILIVNSLDKEFKIGTGLKMNMKLPEIGSRIIYRYHEVDPRTGIPETPAFYNMVKGK
jgi:DNA ligase-1